jgi:predicted glycosyltransferase
MGLRFLFYCHDTFGLGHFRRTLSLAKHFTTTLPDAEALIVTGSPLAHAFELPPRVDYIKLPTVTKRSDGTYAAHSLALDFPAIRDLRAALLREAAQAYHPDVFLVDHAPLGLKKEALPTLTYLRTTHPTCLCVLGLRDILDASYLVRQSWTQEGVYSALEQLYHLILVYGSQQFFDIVTEYALSPTVARRVRFCGYLDRLKTAFSENGATHTNPRVTSLRHELAPYTDRLVVLTAGGGGDGFPLMQTYLLGLGQLEKPAFTSVLVTGPLMEANEVRLLRELAANLPADTVRIESFLPNPLLLFSAADLVVSMAGYNTVCELLALGQRTLLVPRFTPRQEQLVRATLLAERGLVHMLHPEHLTPERLMDLVLHSLVQPRPRAEQLVEAGIVFHGQTIAAQAMLEGLNSLHDQSQQWLMQVVV